MAKRSGIFGGEDPFEIARAWLAAAEASEPNDPNAMALATVDEAGAPNVRMVLLKSIGNTGLEFYTNYGSTKAQEIDACGSAALVLHWKSLRRQMRVRGSIARTTDAEADAYYATRSMQSRIGAWASRQSQPLKSRTALMAEVAKQTARHGVNPPRPPFWGGYRLIPSAFEFWADGDFRLHDRYRWQRTDPESAWQVERLNP